MQKAHLGCAEVLLAHGDVNVNFVDDQGHTIIAHAVQDLADSNAANAIAQAEFLVQRKNADVTIKDAKGRQALHLLAHTFAPKLKNDFVNSVRD